MWNRYRSLKPWERRYIASLGLGVALLAGILINHFALSGYVGTPWLLAAAVAVFGTSIWLQRGVTDAFVRENPELERWVTPDRSWWQDEGKPYLPIWAIWLWRWLFGPRPLKPD